MPRFACPHCQEVVHASEEDRGQSIRCPHCQLTLKVPAGQSAAVSRSTHDADDDDDRFRRPRRRRRSAPAKSGWPTWVIASIAGAALFLFSTCGGCVWWLARNAKEIGHEIATGAITSDISVAADVLARDYQQNRANADGKYIGNDLRVTGMVESSRREPDGTHLVILQGGPTAKGITIQCQFNGLERDERHRLRNLTKGQQVIIQGTCEGLVGNQVMLEDCAIVQ